ncbi:hypothetical protein KJ068_10825 [bacterium]|nr:hypothetical protein [bacterium]NUM74358.1 hypothetical protein [candidate division KSB1 bacterium]
MTSRSIFQLLLLAGLALLVWLNPSLKTRPAIKLTLYVFAALAFIVLSFLNWRDGF